MGGMMGGMGGGSSSGGSAQAAYQPQAQAEADRGYQSLLRPMFSQGLAGIQGLGDVSPAGQAWPNVNAAATSIANNPYADQMIQGGTNANDYFTGGVMPNIYQGAPRLADIANKAYGAVDNPAYAAAQDVGNKFSGDFQGATKQLLGDAFNPNYLESIRLGNEAGARQFGTGMDIRNTAFDPQNALRNRTMSRLTDRLGASLANQGLSGTPYGGGVLGNALSNAGIDWENNLLQRQISGGNAASGLDTQGIEQRLRPALAATQSGISDIGAAGGSLTSALNALMSPADRRLSALAQGGNIASGGFSGANQLLQQGAQGMNTYAGMPFTNFNQGQNSVLGAMQNLITLGNENYRIPQQVIGDLQSYLKLGQSGSELGNNIGTTNFNQTAQGIGGAANLLSGPLGFGGGGGSSSGSGLLGNALGLGGGGGLGSIFGNGINYAGDFGGGVAGLADVSQILPEAAGGGGLLSSLAPAALSA